MATFPTGTYAPAEKASGNVIQASFFNDPEAEIIAIENELRTGLTNLLQVAPGVSQTASTGSNNFAGPSSLASLQVNAGSTLTTLQVTGNSTFNGNVTIAGTLTLTGEGVLSRLPVAKLTSSAAQGVAHNTWTGLAWDVEEQDSTALHSTSVNSSRLNLTSSGLWSFGGQASWATFGANPSTLFVGIRVLVNDSTTVTGGQGFPGNVIPIFGQPISGLYYAASTTDYLTVQVWQNSASTATVGTSTLVGPTQFWAVRVSR